MPQLSASAPVGRAPRSSPLTRLQLLIVDCCVLLAVALLWNRNQLPQWMRLQFPAEATLTAEQLTMLETMSTRPYRFDENAVLLVGDSILLGHPWRADIIGFPGIMPARLLHVMEQQLPGRHYEVIVLWVGTVTMPGGPAMLWLYLEPTVEMVRIARAHSDRVVVVGPMPFAEVRERDALGNRVLKAGPGTGRMREALRELRSRLPDQQIIDSEPFFISAVSRGMFRQYYRDAVHLSVAGFEAFHEYLRQQPQLVVMPKKQLEKTPTDLSP